MQISTSVGVVQAMVFSLTTRARPPGANNAPTYLPVQSRATAGQRMYRPSRAFVSLKPRQIVGQIHDVLFGHGPDHLVHGGVVAGPLGGLVVTQRFQQVILALRSKPRHLIAPGEIR